MRTARPIYVVIGVVLLAAVVIVSILKRMESGRSHLPGSDMSYLSASAIPGHLEALKSPDASARKKAAHILWEMGADAKEATPTLLEVAKDGDAEVRAAAVKALGRTGEGTPDAIPGLLEALEDKDAPVRAAAATSLAETWRWMAPPRRSDDQREKIGPARDSQGRRREVQGNPSPGPPPAEIAPPSVAMAQKAVPLLTAALRDSDVHVRANAAEALAETGPLGEPAVSDLVKLLQTDEDSNVRLQAILALSNIGPGAKAAVPELTQKLRSEKDDGVRVNTAVALGSIHANPETVVPALIETVLTDKHSDARRAAMRSIGQFGREAKRALPLLEKAAKDPKNQQSKDTMQQINQLRSFIEDQVEGSAKDRAQGPSPSKRPPSK
jgi:HEAT repeat protein